MKLAIYQVDAFADEVFRGNPAAICPLERWLDDGLMQQIAAENNLAETAFFVKDREKYGIRWFTPETEVDLCGHATLASAHIILQYFDPTAHKVNFHSPRSGPLGVEKKGDGLLVLDFPADPPVEVKQIQEIEEAMGKAPLKTLKGKTDYLIIYQNQQEIEALSPNFFLLDKVDARGVIASAPGKEVDFVSRFFAPQSGIPEDPVTGSAHTTMIPYWAGRLGKNKLSARQLSKRGGSLECELVGERVKIGGTAVTYLAGEIFL